MMFFARKHFLFLLVLIFISGSSGHAQNLHQRYKGSWNCNRLSTDGADSVSLYNACRKCELAGQEFVKTSPSSGKCEGSSSGGELSNQDIAKGKLEEKEGDADYRSDDWLGASSSYRTALKYFESAGSRGDVARIERKKNAADCKYGQKVARDKEAAGDLRKALSNLLNALPQCESSGSDVSSVEGEIGRLRGKIEEQKARVSVPARKTERVPKIRGPGPIEWDELYRGREMLVDEECPNYSYYFDDLPYLAICEYWTIGSIENKVAVMPSEIPERMRDFWRTGKKATWQAKGCDAGFSKENAEGGAKVRASTYANAEAKSGVAYYGSEKFRFDPETEFYTCRILRKPLGSR